MRCLQPMPNGVWSRWSHRRWAWRSLKRCVAACCAVAARPRHTRSRTNAPTVKQWRCIRGVWEMISQGLQSPRFRCMPLDQGLAIPVATPRLSRAPAQTLRSRTPQKALVMEGATRPAIILFRFRRLAAVEFPNACCSQLICSQSYSSPLSPSGQVIASSLLLGAAIYRHPPNCSRLQVGSPTSLTTLSGNRTGHPHAPWQSLFRFGYRQMAPPLARLHFVG